MENSISFDFNPRLSYIAAADCPKSTIQWYAFSDLNWHCSFNVLAEWLTEVMHICMHISLHCYNASISGNRCSLLKCKCNAWCHESSLKRQKTGCITLLAGAIWQNVISYEVFTTIIWASQCLQSTTHILRGVHQICDVNTGNTHWVFSVEMESKTHLSNYDFLTSRVANQHAFEECGKLQTS